VEKHELEKKIRDIPGFPKAGIIFKDITPLLLDTKSFKQAIDIMADYYKDKNITSIVSAEARGFIFGGALAYKLGVGFIPARKPGKLPYKTVRQKYELEYGTDALEIHEDAIKFGDRVLIVDDVIATGGTTVAQAELIEKMGGEVVGFCFLVELAFLNPREKLKEYDVFSLIICDK